MTRTYTPLKPADLKKAVKLAQKDKRCAAWIVADPDGDGHWFVTLYFARKIDPALAICLESFSITPEPTGLEVSGTNLVKVPVESCPALARIIEKAKGSADKVDLHRTFGRTTVARSTDYKGRDHDLYVIADGEGEPLTMVQPEYATVVGMLDDGATFTGNGDKGVISLWNGEELTALVMPFRPS